MIRMKPFSLFREREKKLFPSVFHYYHCYYMFSACLAKETRWRMAEQQVLFFLASSSLLLLLLPSSSFFLVVVIQRSGSSSYLQQRVSRCISIPTEVTLSPVTHSLLAFQLPEGERVLRCTRRTADRGENKRRWMTTFTLAACGRCIGVRVLCSSSLIFFHPPLLFSSSMHSSFRPLLFLPTSMSPPPTPPYTPLLIFKDRCSSS